MAELSRGADPCGGCLSASNRVLRPKHKWGIVGILTASLLMLCSSAASPRVQHPRPPECDGEPWYSMPVAYSAMMHTLCARHGVPVWLAVRLVQTESPDWNPRSVSPKNEDGSRDYGLAQINDANFKKFSDWYTHSRGFNPLEAWDSLDVGLAHLSWLHSEFGDWTKAVMGYNTGEERVRRGTVKPKTIVYAKAILGARYGIEEGNW